LRPHTYATQDLQEARFCQLRWNLEIAWIRRETWVLLWAIYFEKLISKKQETKIPWSKTKEQSLEIGLLVLLNFADFKQVIMIYRLYLLVLSVLSYVWFFYYKKLNSFRNVLKLLLTINYRVRRQNKYFLRVQE